MFQFNYHAAPPARIEGAASPATADAGADRVLLAWAEHCIECAAPACYTSCDLFDPTETGKCRRIEGGIVPVRTPSGLAADIRFRRWGKLEAQGNATLLPAAQVARWEAVTNRLMPLAATLGRVIGRLAGSARWQNVTETLFKRLNTRLAARQDATQPLPNGFAISIDNPEAEPTRLLLTISIDKLRMARQLRADQLPPPVTLPIALTPGLNQRVEPVYGAEAILQSGLPFLIAVTPLDREEMRVIIHQLDFIYQPAADARADAVGAATVADKPAKLVIFDLDNTLWDGVLLEGPVWLRPGVAALFAALDERGILLSVASKNAPDDALAQVAAFGLTDYLLFPQIGWLPKSASIAAIVNAIDIGIDTVIFIDDNPFERAEVSAVLPAVEVLGDDALSALAAHPRLQGSVTAESRHRRAMYQSAIIRSQAAAGYGADYQQFLRSCAITLSIRPPEAADFERVCELVQRTNQLNFSGRKYDREAISAVLADGRLHRVIDCADHFGSYGTVGFCIAHFEPMAAGAGARLVVDDFMLSCRVQGKYIEKALLHDLVSRHDGSVSEILIDFRKTDRNRAAQLVLEDIGFETDDDGRYRLACQPSDLAVDFLTVESR